MAHRPKAAVLAIGTFNPPNVTRQADYSAFLSEIKPICDKTMIKKGGTHVPRDSLGKNKGILTDGAPSLDARQDILVSLVPELGKKAALVAIKKWGQPEWKSKITHLIVHSNSGFHMPGADCQITRLLDLSLDVKRTMLYFQGSYVGGTLLRMAKDTAENNPDARILIVCSKITLTWSNGPHKTNSDSLLAQARIHGGVAALIVGTKLDGFKERPLFELIDASETIIPESDGAIEGILSEIGLTCRISERARELIPERTQNFLRNLLDSGPYRRGGDWSSFFWAIHTGDRAILDRIEQTLGLNQRELEVTRHVLNEYGDIGSASVFFILNEIMGRGHKKDEWGILFAFGAGLTLDAVLLRRFP